MTAPIAIVGGGPIGLTLALLLAHRHVPTVVFDARSIDEARRDRRLLALSRGTLETLRAIAPMNALPLADIKTVIVSSRGEFGRAILDEADIDARPLGATVRYADLLGVLDSACSDQPLIEALRPGLVTSVRNEPNQVTIELAGGATHTALLAINAEGVSARPGAADIGHAALIADVDVEGPPANTAHERFTRDGPLALLPLPGASTGRARPMALVWCMPSAVADRREALSDDELRAELQAVFGAGNGRIVALRARGRHPLIESSRDELREHRIVYVGNAAQTLHPVAGQGFNLGVRDCVALADAIGTSFASHEDPFAHLPSYERARKLDRVAIRAITRAVPGFFSTRFAPIAAVRSFGLTMLSVVPNLRIQFARLLMFGVRS